MKPSWILGLCTVTVFLSTSANAWNVKTCNGNIRGLLSHTTFELNRCSISSGGSREAVITHAMSEWNRITGVADRFSSTDGDTNCNITTGNDRYEVGYATSSSLDGAAGTAKIRYHGCTWPWSNGDVKEADVFIRSSLSTSPIDQQSGTLGARETAIHEFGHVLGSNHEDRWMSVMCASNTCGKQGEWDTYGSHYNRAESVMPDDVSMAVAWHASSNAGRPDIFASGWHHSGTSAVRNQNTVSTYTLCPGQTMSVKVSHGNKGKAHLTSSNPAQARIVLSSNAVISIYDYTAAYFNVWGNSGSFYTNTLSFTVPNVPPGTYEVGWVVDSGNTITEDDNGNNSALINRRIFVPSGCPGD